MSNLNLRNITNSFQDVQLASLASWPQAKEIAPCDRGGPYVVMQQGYDPADPKMIADEFVLGRSGKWLSLSYFYKLPIPERRAEFIFGTAGEVMQMMGNLPPVAAIIHPGEKAQPDATSAATEPDEMAAALQRGKGQPAGNAGSTPEAAK
jgi:hypothetical protein